MNLLNRIYQFIIHNQVSRALRWLVLVGVDLLLTTMSMELILEFFIGAQYWWLVLVAFSLRVITYQLTGVYNISLRNISIRDLWAVTRASWIPILPMLFVAVYLSISPWLMLLEYGINFLLTGLSRVCLRIYSELYLESPKNVVKNDIQRVLIIGAGVAGSAVSRELSKKDSQFYIVGFIDDDKNLQKRKIRQIPILGRTEDIPEIVASENISKMIIAIPSAKGKDVRRIIRICESQHIDFQIVPSLTELINQDVSIDHIRDIQPDDLLGRNAVDIREMNLEYINKDSSVLVTGAGGSIGSELCRQILHFQPKVLILSEMNEGNLYDIELELKEALGATTLVPLISDIRNKERMEEIFAEYKPTLLFHAAAYKQVPLMEDNVSECIENNVKGTQNLVDLADQYGVSRFIFISTDKAVRPSSCMGATKRLCEIIIQAKSEVSSTQFSSVRFGNVLGSRGSVIPLFKKQIADGGPVTVTDPNIERYFMTIKEAVSLVLQCGKMSRSGENFILDMGKPVKIVELAKQMIAISNRDRRHPIDIEFVGLRPGEKLTEELFYDEGQASKTAHDKILIGKPRCFDLDMVQKELVELFAFANANTNPSAIRQALFNCIDSLMAAPVPD